MDSGATKLMCNNMSSFISSEPSCQESVEIGDGETLKVAGKGTVWGTVKAFEKRCTIKFNNVLYVPTLNVNLMSLRKIRKLNYSVLFTDDEHGHGICKVLHNSNNKV